MWRHSFKRAQARSLHPPGEPQPDFPMKKGMQQFIKIMGRGRKMLSSWEQLGF